MSEERAERLAGISLFRALPRERLLALAARFVPRRTARGQVIHAEGAPATALHLVSLGRVKVSRGTTDGRAVLLRVHGPGELLDLVRDVHLATAVALDAGEVWALPRAALREIADDPAFGRAWLAEVERRLNEAEARIAELQTATADQRLASALLRLARPTVALTRQDLAELTGSSLFTTSRTLAAWHRRRWVDAGRERITVLDAGALGTIRG